VRHNIDVTFHSYTVKHNDSVMVLHELRLCLVLIVALIGFVPNFPK